MADNSLDPHFSLFNCHINEAKDKALAYTEKHMDSEIHERLVELDTEGIMALNPEKPEEAFLYGLIAGFVNSNREI